MEAQFSATDNGFDLHFAGRLVLRHTHDCPALAIARGKADVTMHHGNFRITDEPHGLIGPRESRIAHNVAYLLHNGIEAAQLSIESGNLVVTAADPAIDRLWLRFHAEPGEAVWGGGEQLSYLNLADRRFPMWTSEPGVGRDKSTALTQAMDATGMAGGDYWTTNYPQPTFLTSRWLAVHLDATCYSALDFTDPARHEVEVWAGAASFELFAAEGPVELVGQLSARFGRQPPLPDWTIGGAIVGLKDGARSFERLEQFIAAGTAVSALWCEDWAGIRETSFGRRLFWDWRRDNQRFPDLPERIAALRARGIRFLAYANPYLANDGILYEKAREGGHFCLRQDSDEVYLVDFGEFECGVIDFTRAETRDWFAEQVLAREMLDMGVSGWMADFGEYLPTDVRLADGSDPMTCTIAGRCCGPRSMRRRSSAVARPAMRSSSCAPGSRGCRRIARFCGQGTSRSILPGMKGSALSSRRRFRRGLSAMPTAIRIAAVTPRSTATSARWN